MIISFWSSCSIFFCCCFALKTDLFIGIPPGVGASQFDGTMICQFLGSSTSPSGIDPEINEYLINVGATIGSGGYIDGLALQVMDDDKYHDNNNHRRLDENPSACGHYINHSSLSDNVIPISFVWSDICSQKYLSKPLALNRITSNDDIDALFFKLPNVIRSDNSPRYHICIDYWNDPSIDDESTVYYTGEGENCGIVFCAKQDIEPNTELFFNYRLGSPPPLWAKDWYNFTNK